MILSGLEIHNQVEAGRIIIEPFCPQQLNPNSYNYRLGAQLKPAPLDVTLDARQKHQLLSQEIPAEGFVLEPGRFYLGRTVEVIGSDFFVPCLIGRSSLGRLGLYVQISADLGNLGFVDSWTLELVAVQPIRVYPGMLLGQVTFWVPAGRRRLYDGKYVRQCEPLESQFGMEFSQNGESQ